MKNLGTVKRYPNLGVRRSDDMVFKNFAGEDLLRKIQYRNACPTLTAVYKGIGKYDKPNDIESIEEYDCVLDWLDKEFGKGMEDASTTALEDAISGMDMTKSPGFPWNKKFSTKAEMEGTAEWTAMLKLVEDFTELQRPRFIWASSLKEETRKISKLADHDIRQFSAAPVEAVIEGRKLFLKQNENFYSQNLETMSAVGMSTRNGGWNRLWKKLSKHAEGFALDEQEWDSSLRAKLLQLVRDLRLRWLSRAEPSNFDELREEVEKYYEEIIESVYALPRGELIQKFLGNPSGSPNTVVDNTIVLAALLMITWMRRCSDSYVDFKENVSAFLYGDDNTFTVSEEYIDRFNGLSVQEVFATFGVTVKGTLDDLQPRAAADLDFLSFGFTFSEGVAIPKYLKPGKLLASLAFRDNRQGHAFRLQRALAIRELLYGCKEFRLVTDYCRYLMKRFRKVGGPEFERTCALFKEEEELIRLFIPYETDASLKQ